ncbi:MAG TPA: DUF58 domain-containing protein, partial [Flavobacteriales bacterium]|nr:DUF58 domain-containing protein [Flavobacteriales bacterium]
MRRFLRTLFLTERFFRVGWGLVLLFVGAFFWGPLYKVGLGAVAALIAATLVDMVLLYRVRHGIQAARTTLDKWSNGDENPVSVEVQSMYTLPMEVRLLDELPVQFQERGLDLHARIAPGGSHTFHYMVRPVTRGVYTYGAINTLVRTPLGLAQRRYRQEQGRSIAVYPSYIHLRKYELMALADRWSMAGVKKVRRSAQRVEFERIRDYIPGDDKRTVNWKATARKSKLMVNQYQDEKAQQIISLIDMGRTMKMPFEGLSLLDRAINATLVLSDIAIKKDDKAGVVTYSDQVHGLLQPSRDKGQIKKVLELLYAQRTDHAETDFDTLFATVRRSLGQRSLLVVYTNFESVNAMRRQLPFLQRLSRAHLVAVVLFKNTELDDLLKLPDHNTMDVYVKTITSKFLYEKQLIQKELESHG